MDLLSDMWNIGFVTEDIADVVKSDKLRNYSAPPQHKIVNGTR